MVLDANKYYESLRFNHYDSGGTCEQRTLVIRVRFDNILEDIVALDYTSTNEFGKDFYSERLKLLFEKFPKKFSERDQRAIDDLRRFLNKVQHSEVTAGEKDYIRSLKTLSRIISICSNTQIPEELSNISADSIQSELPGNSQNLKDRNVACSKLPVSILIDTLNIAKTRESTLEFNNLLKRFINQISDDALCVDFSLVLIEKNGIKTIKPLENISIFSPYDRIDYSAVNDAIKKSTQFLILGLNNISNIDQMRIKSFMVLLLGSATLKFVKPIEELNEIRKSNKVTILPIGLDENIIKDNFFQICPNREAMILTQTKYSEFFSWLYECVKIGCKN